MFHKKNMLKPIHTGAGMEEVESGPEPSVQGKPDPQQFLAGISRRFFVEEGDSFEKTVKKPEYSGVVDEILIKFENIRSKGDSFETFRRRVSIHR